MMNHHRTRGKMLSCGAKLPPTFTTFYNLGLKFTPLMKPLRSDREVARNLGMDRRKVQTVSYVALGKVVYRLQELLRKEIAL